MRFEKLIVSSKAAIEILEKFFERLDTRYSKLEPRFSIASRIEDRVSSRDCQLTFARYCSSDKLNLFTDAAGSLGFGAIFQNHWCYGRWPVDWLHKNIAFLEFYPIVLSLHLRGHLIRNRCILFFTDNEALVYIINKQSCRDKSLMSFVRKLVSVCLKYNIVFKAKHVPGVHNKLADSLSRLQIPILKQLAPAYMNPCPSEIPHHLQPQHWQL